jgi:hypothetical protein
VYAAGTNDTYIHLLKSTGSSFQFYYAWHSSAYNANCVVGVAAGRFNPGTRCDLALVYDYPDALTRIHMFKSQGLSFALDGGSDGWWESASWPAQHMRCVVSGDFDNDGYGDIADVYDYGDVHTTLHVWRSTGSAFVLSHGSAGWWSTPEGSSYYAYKVARGTAGDVDGDGFDDVILGYRSNVSTTRFHVFLSSGTDFEYQGEWWSSSQYPIDKFRGMVCGNFNGYGGAAKLAEEEDIPVLPVAFTLNQNYPNPFNPVTVISYSLPSAAHVTLDIYNILGQRVTTLIDGRMEAGEHAVTWDASRYASGVYLYRLHTEQATETKKMLLLK